jgi:hypothetical protein
MFKMGSYCSFGHLKHKLWPKEGAGVEFPGVSQFWFPTTKSRESTRNTWVQKTCDIPLERSRRDLQLCFRQRVNRRFASKVMKLQSCGSPEVARFRDSHAGVPGQKGHLDATPAVNHRVYYKGEVVSFPKGEGAGFPTQGSEVVAYSRAWVVVCQSESEFTRGLSQHQKVPWWVLKGKVMVSPRSRPWLFLAPKVLQLWANHLEWFMEGPWKWVKLVHSS